MLNAEETQRYSRHFSLPQVGVAGQLKLRNAKVLCVGAGGLGSPLLFYLAAAGVGRLGIVDPDLLELSNLQRQILYQTTDLQQNKASLAKAKLQALNPHVEIICYPQRLSAANALEIIADYDIVADGSDNFATRYLVNEACFRLEKPNVFASVSQFTGQCTIFTADNGPCYRCVYEQFPNADEIPNCSEAGVLGVLPGILGSIQANEVLKLILGLGDSLIARLLQLDSLQMKFQELAIPRNPNCQLCSKPATETLFDLVLPSCEMSPEKLPAITMRELNALQKNSKVFLLDVREVFEHQQNNLGGVLIPLAELPNRLEELNPLQPIVVYCQSGRRSQRALKILQDAGFVGMRYLLGGMDAGVGWISEA